MAPMDRFEVLFSKHNVDFRRRLLANDVVLTVYPTHTVLTSCTRLNSAESIVGTAMMLGVLEMGWPGSIFRFRFPIPDDSVVLRRKHQQARRDYRLAWRWAAKFLIPDRMIEDLRRSECEIGEFCGRETVTPDLVIYRLSMLPVA